MTDAAKLTTQARATVTRAIRLCHKAGWHTTAAHLINDMNTAGTDLRELLIVRDFAEDALERLAANGFDA